MRSARTNHLSDFLTGAAARAAPTWREMELMAKRRNPRAEKAGGSRLRWERRQRKLVIGCGTLAALALVGLLLLQVLPIRPDHADDDHPHAPPPHGGMVVSVGQGKQHYHAEVVVGPTGAVELYPLGEEAGEQFPVGPQHLAVRVRPDGEAEDSSVLLRPDPVMGPADRPVARFLGRLPAHLIGRGLTFRVEDMDFRGEQFSFEFAWQGEGSEAEQNARYEQEQRQIYLTARGRYTEDDIAAAGRQTAAAKYPRSHLTHELRPRAGDRLCPTSRVKANANFAWRVGGKTYVFCCPPCIDDFVRAAKERPAEVLDPEAYVKKD